MGKTIKHTTLSIVSLFALSGCAAGMNEEFSCNEVGGVSGCATMGDIRANMSAYEQHNNKNRTTATLQAPSSEFLALPRRTREGQPTRSEDEVKKVTIFPFTNEHGHFIDTTDIYFILSDSQWQGRLPQAIKKD